MNPAPADWLFDKDGAACLILDGERVRDDYGDVIGWIKAGNVYLLHGEHVGWFEGGVIYDGINCALTFTRRRMGYLPSEPRLAADPDLPQLAPPPVFPQLEAAPGKPGRGAWSRHDVFDYFGA